MRNFRTLFAWSLIGHFLIMGIVLAGSALPRRTAPARAVYHVQMVEAGGSPAPAAPAVEPAAAPEKTPEPEVRISPEEQKRREEEERKRREDARRREEERRRRAEEQARVRRELEEARRNREEQDKKRREQEQKELAELQQLRSELSEARDVGGFRAEAGSAAALPPGYADRVYNLIFSSWEPAAVRSGAELSFIIKADGSVSAVNIEKSSGSAVYDQSCRGAVINAGRMPPLPDGFGREGVRVYVTFKN